MAKAAVNVVCTISALAMFGRMCRIAMRGGDTPIARAAVTYSRSRIDSTCPRVSRAYTGIATTPMAIIAF